MWVEHRAARGTGEWMRNCLPAGRLREAADQRETAACLKLPSKLAQGGEPVHP